MEESIRIYCDKLTNGWMGRQLPRHLKSVGLVLQKTEAYTTIITDYSQFHKLWFQDALNYAQAEGVVSELEADAWLNDITKRQDAGTFFAGFLTVVSLAIKP